MRTIISVVLISGFLLFPDLLMSQENISVIRGRVSDEEGNPLTGAGITIENTLLGTYSDMNGSYHLNGLRDGNYGLRFSFIGYESRIIEIDLKGEAIVDVSLVRKPFLAGEVIINALRAGTHTPLAYTTIENEQLEKHNTGQDIPFLLSLTPSLVETSEAGNGIGYTNLRIRGSDASRINVTVDGIPLNDPESQQVFWVDIPDLASSIDNIQIQRGAGTSSNGAGAFGATINIQTSIPEKEAFARISAALGSFNTSKIMVSAGTGLLDDKFAFQIRYSDLKSDGFIDRTGSDHRSALINGVIRTQRSHIKANIILGEEHTGIGWWGVPKEMLSVSRTYNPAGEYSDQDGIIRYYDNESDNYNQYHYQLVYGLNINKDLNLNAALHYTDGRGYYEEFKEDPTFADYGLPDITVGESVISQSDLVRRKWMSNDFYGIVYSLKYKRPAIHTTLGGGANYYSGDHFGKIIWMKYAGDIEKDHQWYLNNGKKAEISFYGKADYFLTDRLSFYADLQFRHIDYKMTGEDDDLKNLGQTHSFNFFNPKAGLFLSIDQNRDAYLSFSVANREPTRSDFKEAAGDPEATPRSETLYDTELGYKMRREKYSTAVNLYAMVYKDQLVPTGELSKTGYSIMTNVEKSHRLGIEVITALKPFTFLNWDINLTLSRNKIMDFIEHYIDYNTSDWSEEYKSKNLGSVDIAYSPSAIGSSDINIKILKNTEIHLISKYVGRQYFDNTMNDERAIDPYFVNSLRIDFEPPVRKIRNTRFQFLINNIFNSEYESNAYGGNWYEDSIEKTWSYYFPQAGINFMLKAELTF